MNSPRQFFCVDCRALVLICSHCDRGNRYCSQQCSTKVRSASVRAAGKRYQATFRGRLNNAERQARYRARVRAVNKVTHHGSLEPVVSAEVVPEPMEMVASRVVDRCCACTRSVSSFVRLDFLRRHFSRPAQTTLWSKTQDDYP